MHLTKTCPFSKVKVLIRIIIVPVPIIAALSLAFLRHSFQLVPLKLISVRLTQHYHLLNLLRLACVVDSGTDLITYFLVFFAYLNLERCLDGSFFLLYGLSAGVLVLGGVSEEGHCGLELFKQAVFIDKPAPRLDHRCIQLRLEDPSLCIMLRLFDPAETVLKLGQASVKLGV